MSGFAVRVKGYVHELRRRNVFKVATVYAVTAWGAVMGAAQLFPVFGAPNWVVEVFAGFAVLGFPIAIVLAWAYEATPEGVVRDRADAAAFAPVAPPDAVTALFGAHGVLRVTWRDAHGGEQERVLDKPFAIGREPTCAIRFDDPLVSRRHAEVGIAGGAWYVADLGSRNGTLLDGQLITRAALPPRCAIRLSAAGPIVNVELRASGATTTVLAQSRG